MSVLQVVEYIYDWNETNQTWTFKVNGTATNENVTIKKGNAVWLYNSIDGIWYRNITLNYFLFNLTDGHNYMSLAPYSNYTFGNVSFRSMRNSTGGSKNMSYVFSFEDFASWNNTGKVWESYFYNFSWNNDTRIGKNANNSLDAIWIYSNNSNVTYNSSLDYIVGNWSPDY